MRTCNRCQLPIQGVGVYQHGGSYHIQCTTSEVFIVANYGPEYVHASTSLYPPAQLPSPTYLDVQRMISDALNRGKTRFGK